MIEDRRTNLPNPNLIGALSEDRRAMYSEIEKDAAIEQETRLRECPKINFTFSYPYGNGFEGQFVSSITSMILHEMSKPPENRLLHGICSSEGPYVSMNRGRIAGMFLNSYPGSHLIMIDPDIEFQPNILEMFKEHIENSKDGIIANKEAHIIAGRVDLLNGLPVFYKLNDDHSRTHQPFAFEGLRQFDLVGTGIICISRYCLEQMYMHYKSVAHFFHHDIIEKGDSIREMGDDFSFCLHAKTCGFDVYGAWDIFGQHYKMNRVIGCYPDAKRLIML